MATTQHYYSQHYCPQEIHATFLEKLAAIDAKLLEKLDALRTKHSAPTPLTENTPPSSALPSTSDTPITHNIETPITHHTENPITHTSIDTENPMTHHTENPINLALPPIWDTPVTWTEFFPPPPSTTLACVNTIPPSDTAPADPFCSPCSPVFASPKSSAHSAPSNPVPPEPEKFPPDNSPSHNHPLPGYPPPHTALPNPVSPNPVLPKPPQSSHTHPASENPITRKPTTPILPTPPHPPHSTEPPQFPHTRDHIIEVTVSTNHPDDGAPPPPAKPAFSVATARDVGPLPLLLLDADRPPSAPPPPRAQSSRPILPVRAPPSQATGTMQHPQSGGILSPARVCRARRTYHHSSVPPPVATYLKQFLMESKIEATTEVLKRLAQASCNPKGNCEERLRRYMVSTLKSRIRSIKDPPHLADHSKGLHLAGFSMTSGMGPLRTGQLLAPRFRPTPQLGLGPSVPLKTIQTGNSYPKPIFGPTLGDKGILKRWGLLGSLFY